jgi:hypothetical protein
MEIRVIRKDKGLGDTVARITRLTGIQYVANVISNGDPSVPCVPCKNKQENLNKKFPFGKQ